MKNLIWICCAIYIYNNSYNSVDSKIYPPASKQNTFQIKKSKDKTLLEVYLPNKKTVEYYITDTSISYQGKNFNLLLPIKKYVATSTAHLGLLSELEEDKGLIGFPETNRIYSSKIRRRIKNREILDVGNAFNLNIEKIIQLRPQVIFSSYVSSQKRLYRLLENNGIPIIFINEYSAQTPLYKAEWIKVFALFFKKEEKAFSLFKKIEGNYRKLQSIASTTIYKPKIMAGIMYGDIWYTPGGKSFQAELLKDAGTEYIWNHNKETGSIQSSFETMLNLTEHVDFWVNASDFSSRESLLQSNKHYRLFPAFKKNTILVYTKRKKELSNDYFESGTFHCDKVLKDLIYFFHQDLLPDYQSVYYEKLK